MTKKLRCFGGPLDGQLIEHPEFCEFRAWTDENGKVDEKAYVFMGVKILEIVGYALVYTKTPPSSLTSEYAARVARHMLGLTE